jgi:hypothetical protein
MFSLQKKSVFVKFWLGNSFEEVNEESSHIFWSKITYIIMQKKKHLHEARTTLFHAGFLYGMFFRNVGRLSTDYMDIS